MQFYFSTAHRGLVGIPAIHGLFPGKWQKSAKAIAKVADKQT
jgi:hypothetical protein